MASRLLNYNYETVLDQRVRGDHGRGCGVQRWILLYVFAAVRVPLKLLFANLN